ncbi:MAG: cbb3-type cytochrome c oxidase subunit I [Chloroflexi bacterium]|uniref:Cbb3-type cytochrome c oxidase subunit I n=1 Tax=Candidatus Chlorohelix allophototropha TaxID=3003348 RepID=A0A8T7LY34_9CHLR|nr:cbb3-type cytochrome c oxidase subunit I [Chloroflexota bacterium]WJW67764.1 cbb3-type cytochrome c oxidase subunit I [Chloroflexota bacterium L227-S17]
MNEEYSAARSWIYSSAVWLAVGTSFAMIAATEMVFPDFLGGVSFLEFGRLRPIHVNGVTFFWLSMAYYGAFFYIVPKLTGRALWSENLAKIVMWAWNFLGIFMVITLMAGMTQGREYAEMIWPIDIFVAIATSLNAFNILMTISQRAEKKIYASLWYIMGAVVWLPIVYAIGNVIWSPLAGGDNPFAGSLAGINDATWNWFYGHNILGLWFTPGGAALVYYIVPVVTRTPLYSHILSLVAFWSLALFYPLVGQHHLLSTPTPGWLKTVATVASIGLFVPVITFLTNIWMTMRGNWGRIYASLPLKYVIVGTVFYFVTCIQGPFQAIQSFNRLVHFTNWIVGHAHLALLGTMTMWVMGAIYYIIPVTLKRRIWSPGLCEIQFWLVTGGFLLIMISLQIVGLIQGAMWLNGETVYKTVSSLKPFFMMRAFGGALVVIGGYIQLYNIYKTVRSGPKVDSFVPQTAAEVGA